MSFRQSITSDIRLVHIDCHASNISLGRPGIDKDTNISTTFQQRIQVGDILLPAYAIGPLVDINRFTLAAQTVVRTAVMTYTERSHETHQFDSRFIIFTGDDTDHIFQLRTVYSRKLFLPFGDIQQIDR